MKISSDHQIHKTCETSDLISLYAQILSVFIPQYSRNVVQ